MKQFIDIGIMCYPGVQLAAVHGLTDIFVMANKLESIPTPEADSYVSAALDIPSEFDNNMHFRVSHWQPCKEGLVPVLSFNSDAVDPGDLHMIVVPGALDSITESQVDTSIVEWIRHQYQRGALVSSVCKGAYWLAKSGILHGRTITTHWSLEDDFSRSFPDINLDLGQIIIDDGQVITAGGVMAWIDLGLTLVGRYLSPSVVLQLAKFLLVDPPHREQRYYSHFNPRFDHGDGVVLRLQNWLAQHYHHPVSLANLSELGEVSERTVTRRFKSALAMTPKAYIQQIRVSKARSYLENTVLPLTQISILVGYEDVNSLRRQFTHHVGLSPSDYRRRFSHLKAAL